jgi:hypothetical protein
MRRLPFILWLLVLVSSAPARAAEGDLTMISRTDMIAILQQAGITGVVDGTSDEASPWVEGKTASGINVVVDFYQCEAGLSGPERKCPSFRFKVYWDNARNIDAKTANAYNEKFVFARGFVSSDGKFLTIDFAMSLAGGVTRDHILQNLNLFLLTVIDFTTMVMP